MIVLLDIFRLNESEIRMLPIEFDFFGALSQLKCKRMDRPSCVQALVCETEGFALSEERDVGIREGRFFLYFSLCCVFGAGICGVDGTRADCPFASGQVISVMLIFRLVYSMSCVFSSSGEKMSSQIQGSLLI
jgi:hypothetical protein